MLSPIDNLQGKQINMLGIKALSTHAMLLFQCVNSRCIYKYNQGLERMTDTNLAMSIRLIAIHINQKDNMSKEKTILKF